MKDRRNAIIIVETMMIVLLVLLLLIRFRDSRGSVKAILSPAESTSAAETVPNEEPYVKLPDKSVSTAPESENGDAEDSGARASSGDPYETEVI